MKVLVVDDEASLREVVGSYLRHSGYEVFEAATGKEGWELFLGTQPHFVVLDLMLPDLPGEELCRMIRRTSPVPLLMLSAKVSEEARVEGFRLGADDYLTKPFSPRELMLRIKAILKRSARQAPGKILATADGQLTVDCETLSVHKAEKKVELTPTELRLLQTFLERPGQTLTRAQLADVALGNSFEGFDRTLDVHIKNLRAKIEADPRHPKYIETVFGFGYRLGGRS